MFKLIKSVSFLAIILLSIGSYSTPQTIAQTATEPVLIPLENLEFTPKRSELTEPGKVDIQIKLGDFLPISDNSTCRFTFNQIGQNGEAIQTSENFVETTYLNRSCVGKLAKEKQIAKNITLSLVVTTPDNQKFGSYLGFIIGQNTENLIIDPNKYSLPLELTTKPEVNIIIQRKEFIVGNKTQVQVEINNRDDFTLMNFVLKTNIPSKIGKIDCQSFKFTENKLDGQIIFNPQFSPSINTYAAEQNTANCVSDEYNFQLVLASLEPNKTTRLNFELGMEKPGDLKFDFTTNLDQKGISRQTSAITVIKPKGSDSSNFPVWVVVVAIIVAVLAIGGGIYWWVTKEI
jgi:hypothetical protein